MCFRAESGEGAVNILAWRLDGRRDFPEFVPFSNFLCARSYTPCLFSVWEVQAGAMQSEGSRRQG